MTRTHTGYITRAQLYAPSSRLELELAGEGPENAAEGGEVDEESDVEELPLDSMFIEDEDEEAMYVSD